MNPNEENIINKDTAVTWTSAWRAQNPNGPNAFLIPAADFVEVLNEIGVLDDATAQQAQDRANQLDAQIRGYLGIDGQTNKIIFVGTEKDNGGVYRDIIDGTIDGEEGKPAKTVGTSNTSSGIFDFSHPCPPTCDPDSPLS